MLTSHDLQVVFLVCGCFFEGCQLVLSHQSKLKVAVCYPGIVPFVMIGADGNFEGYDIGKYLCTVGALTYLHTWFSCRASQNL